MSSGGQSKTPLQRVTSGPCAAFINLKHPNNLIAWSTQAKAEFHAY